MNRKSILAAAIAIGAASSFSAGAANLTPPADNIFPVGGATATDKSLAIGWITDLCDAAATPGGIEVFTTRATFAPASTSNYAIACRMKGTANGAAAGQDVIMLKYSGGSGTGTTNVALGTALANTTSAHWVNYAACATPANPAVINGVNFTVRTGCALVTATDPTYVPKAGLADVEPALLGGAGLALTTASAAVVPFGVLVNNRLFEALQNADPTIAPACDATVASYTEACTPSLPKEVLRGIFKGNILSATSLRDAAGVAIPTPPGGAALSVCRRGNNSGTMASFKAYFLGEGCGSQLQFAKPNDLTTEAAGIAYVSTNTNRVFAGTGNGDVLACLDDRNDQGGGKYAFGIASLETNSYLDVAPGRWRFIKIDGKFPSAENVQTAKYDFFSESACNRPSATNVANVLSAVQSALASGTVIANTQTATGLCGAPRADLVPGAGGAWTQGTLSILPNLASCPALPASLAVSQTSSATHASSVGGTPNNCNPSYTPCATTP